MMTEEKRKELKEFALRKQAELEELIKSKEEGVTTDSGIYAIFTPKYKTYIGQAQNIQIRWAAHLNLLNKQAHYNGKLQRAWKQGLKIVVLETCAPEDLDKREHWCIKYYRTRINGLNVRRGVKPKKN